MFEICLNLNHFFPKFCFVAYFISVLIFVSSCAGQRYKLCTTEVTTHNQCFFFKFIKQVHWLGSSGLINSKWRLSWCNSRSFLESAQFWLPTGTHCLSLTTSKFFLVKIWRILFLNLKNPLLDQPTFFFCFNLSFCSFS